MTVCTTFSCWSAPMLTMTLLALLWIRDILVPDLDLDPRIRTRDLRIGSGSCFFRQ
jgi:hypothetical protein